MIVQQINIANPRRTYIGAHGIKMLKMYNINCSAEKRPICVSEEMAEHYC